MSARSEQPADPSQERDVVRLADDQLERLADLVAERLGRAPLARSPLVDARELARMLGVTRAFVYQHARTLGAVRIGSGDTGRLRFDPEVALAAREAPSAAEPTSATRGGARRRHASKRAAPAKRHPFLEPTATWDVAAGLWRDGSGYPTHDQCWRSRGLGTQGLVAQGPKDEPGATHYDWEVARREWRKQRSKHR